jgi:hypothetical protein
MKTTMVVPSIVLIVAMLVCCSCGVEETAPVAPSVVKSILPLKTGLTWKYRSKRFEPDGTELSVEYAELKVWSSVIRDNERWYSYSLSDSWTYYANRVDGLYTRYHSTYAGLDYWSPPKLLLKYPVKEGDTFIDSDNHAVRVASVHQNVSVLAGNYDCIMYVVTEPDVDSSNAHWRNVMYYRPDVGRILIEQYARTLDGMMFLMIRSELIQATGI